MQKTRIVTVAAAALVCAALAGCSQGATLAGQPSSEQPAELAEASASTEPAGSAAALVATEVPELGGIVTDGDGMTLYRFNKDTAKPPKSNCDGECANAWQPLTTVTEDVTLDGVARELVGTVARSDGSAQVTIGGWPVYRYINDEKPGDINGQGAGDDWFVVTPEGKKASGEPANAVALVVMKVGKLGDIVTDRAGMTLYRFNDDTAKPSKSNCDGECAAEWPPVVTASDEVQVDGVDPALVGTVERTDGSLQVTIAGWPVYRFAGDSVPCDTNGQGLGGKWFAMTPQGKPAGA